MASLATARTLLDIFENIARSEVDLDVVECGEERWTYGELDVISTGLALEMHESYGQKPTVAIVSENHPYILATVLATWKLGGIVAPLDYNVPRDIMERMLLDIRPTFVLVPSNQLHVQKVITESSCAYVPFDANSTTITVLMQRYLVHSAPLPRDEFPQPTLEDIALYVHTSSASSANNVKCAPLSHKSILAGSRARLAWWKRTWPQQSFDHLRVLGWSPWSHIIGISHDIVAATFLTRGTYVFAMIPSAYGEAGKASRFLDVSGQLLETAIEKKPTAFSGVPWVLEGFMRTFSEEKDLERKKRIKTAIQHFKVFGSGGAATSTECVQFATELGIPLVFDIGMTEIGSPIFHSTIDGSKGWNLRDCLVSDASIDLINEDGSPATDEGELVITSRLTSKGYLNSDNSSFTIEDGDLVTFRTGDIYGYVDADRVIWKGRREDYIQMSSGETLDPRVIEAILNQCPSAARNCVVGNNFLRTSSQVVCAIIEPVRHENSSFPDKRLAEIIRTIAVANRGLAPPLRISWSRVLILDAGQQIPLTKKGAVFRKKLEEVFGEQLGKLLNRSDDASVKARTSAPVTPSMIGNPAFGHTKDQIATIVADVVVDALGIPAETLENNADATFAELGMDSSMSTKIVNQLNRRLKMHLPLNTCHTYIDLATLTTAIVAELGIEGPASSDTRASRRLSPQQEEVVIVGQSVRLPGDIQNPRSFWDALIEQRDDIMTPVPPSRWDHASFYRAPNSSDPPSPCDISLDKAGWIDLTSFDHSFFGLGLSEAFSVAPTIRLTLELAFEALENANIPLSKIKGSDMGVFVANAMDDGYIQLLFADKGWGAYSRYWATGTAASTACGRLSYLLDIHGPSITVDTACSSGLIAVHEAVKYLQSGEGESAIVCGANVHPWPGTLGFLTAQKMTSPNGRCATFTNEADGYVPSEGAAGLVLKTKRAALRDGDRIIGVVRSTITKHDGRSQGLVAPNVKAQIGMQIELLEKAGLSPTEIDFLEAHGTGTSLGDLIEIQGINEVFKSSHTSDAPLVIGASKTCLGHTELIAGLIGVLKALGTLKDGVVPGLVQLTESNMNPSLDCSVVPLQIPHENVHLKQNPNRPLRALVLSNGFAGSIAGAILEAPSNDMRVEATSRIPENTPLMFVVSAKSPEALTDYLNKYLDFCLDASPSLFPSICYTSCVGREHYRYRFACVAHNIQDLIARIEERIQNPPSASSPAGRRILFGFPGQGCQYQGMGRYLANQYSGFCEIITDAATKATNLTGYSVLPYLVEDSALPGSISIDNSEVAQVCIYTFQYAMATWLGTLGIYADSVMGHSLGEITAAVISGAFSFEIGMQFVVTRARVLRSDPACPGGMAAIAATEDVVARYIAEMGLQHQISIAVYNAADNNVVSGDLKAIEKLMAAVKRDGMRASKLAVAQGFHSHSIAPGLPALREWLEQQESVMKGLEKRFFSTVLAKEIPKHERLDTQYWVDHAQNAVRFVQTAKLVNKSKIDVIVDIGPQPTVWSNMQTPEFTGKTRLALTGKRGKDQIVAMLTALSALFEKGFHIDFDALNSQTPYKLTMTDIPTYPFQRVHNYPAFVANRHHLLSFGHAIQAPKSSTPQLIIDQALYDFLDLHRIEGRRVLPGAAMVDLFARAANTKSLKSFRFHVPLVLETPEMEVRAEIDEKGLCQLLLQDDFKSRICSGNVGEKASMMTPRQQNSNSTPIHIMSKAEIYECFKNVQFGDLFRTVQEVKFWETHADGDVKVERTSNLSHDRIRKIDACLHMFGSLSSRFAPPMDEDKGAYVPTSLEDFALHTDDIPYNFTCRYYLPLEIGRGARTLSAPFEVFADTGELLLSCKKYSVAWVPRGVVHKEQEVLSPVEAKSWYRSAWVAQPLSRSEAAVPLFEDVLYLGSSANSRIIPVLSTSAKNMVSLFLSDVSDESKITSVPSTMQGRNVIVVIDLSEANHFPDSNEFKTTSVQILSFLKALLENKFRPSCFLAITSWSAPVDLYKEALVQFSGSKASAKSLVGSVVHGMLRAFCRETECHTAAWCLDLLVDTLSQDRIGEIIPHEIHARQTGLFADTFVSYREDASNGSICRLVPVLHPIESVSAKPLLGTTVVVGLSAIGIRVATALIEAGVRQIVFLVLRAEGNAEVQKEIGSLSMGIASCSYRQVDACDLQSLRLTLADINETQGVKNIIHAASLVNDDLMESIDIATYDQMIRPMVVGSWNLHLASQELGLTLDSFVLLSCVNIFSAKPGQVVNISASAFMDSLATHRHNCGLPGISLQLGTQNDTMDGGTSEWGALIMKAMSVPIPCQIVAEPDVNTISTTPSLAQNPVFAHILSSTLSANQSKLSPEEVNKLIVNMLRVAMELQATERLDTNEPLTSCGADSITFAQFKGQVLKELDVDVPVVYLSDDHTINDMIVNIVETYAAA